MLSVDRCRQLLGADDLSEEALRSLRDDLYRLASLVVDDTRRSHEILGRADIEALEERAAICEYGGGLDRAAAEEVAVVQLDAWKRERD